MELSNESKYPKRPPRIQLFPNVRPFYFITFNTAQRAPILDNEAIHQTFIKFCERAHNEYHTSVGNYVLMPDHIHLFVTISEHETTLARWVQALKSVLGKSLLAQGIQKPHWQPGFFDHVLRNSESYCEKWNYVKKNPIRANLIKEGDEWPYQGEIIHLSF